MSVISYLLCSGRVRSLSQTRFLLGPHKGMILPSIRADPSASSVKSHESTVVREHEDTESNRSSYGQHNAVIHTRLSE
jgi:hypothetical protein